MTQKGTTIHSKVLLVLDLDLRMEFEEKLLGKTSLNSGTQVKLGCKIISNFLSVLKTTAEAQVSRCDASKFGLKNNFFHIIYSADSFRSPSISFSTSMLYLQQNKYLSPPY